MRDDQLYAQYLNSIQVQYITGRYFKATTKWNNTEKLKLNKFYYVTDGEFELTIEDKVYIISKGDLVLIPCDVKHSYKLTSKKHMRKHWCHFEALKGSDNFFKNVKTDLIVNIGIDKKLISMFKKLYTYESKHDAISAISSKATLMLIIAKYLENCKNITIKKNADNPELASVINFMQENISRSITIDKLAEFTHLHPNYFIRLFKQYFGSSPIKYFNNMKINVAKEYLQKGNYSIEEISKTLGFSDLYSFSKFFKKNVGISPTRFKSSYIDNEKP